MAGRPDQRQELVFCHRCEDEWRRNEHGLECPRCHSDIVEIIEGRNDPRDNHIDLTHDEDDDNNSDVGMRSPDHDSSPHHNPWAHNAPDPDEPDIQRVAFGPGTGIRIESFRSSSPMRRRGPNSNNAFGTLFQSFSTMFNEHPDGTPFRTQSPGPAHSPWVQGPRTHFSATARVIPPDDAAAHMNQSLTNIQALMHTMLTSVESVQASTIHRNDPNSPGRGGPAEINPFDFFAQALAQFRNPANAAHGDVVYTEEALDRIISQMMEQAGGSSAPGPASATAIAALPKKAADKSMMGSDGKAECSVCMDSVNIGDEVTILPCKHWFHGDCVGAWLKEHDTCPHCRQGIMPKDGNDNIPRSPHQAPRHDQGIFSGPIPGSPPGVPTSRLFSRSPSMPPHYRNAPPIPPQAAMPGSFTQPGMQHPYVPGGYQAYPEPRHFVQPLQPPLPPHPNMAPGLQPPGLQPPPFVPPLQQPLHPQGAAGSWTPGSRRQSTSTRGSSHSSGGEANTSSRVASWFRNLRGASNSSASGNGGANGGGAGNGSS